MKQKDKVNWFNKIENMHPYRTLLYLGMFGSGLIFLFMVFAFVASQPTSDIYARYSMPKTFILSSVLLVASAFTCTKILPSFANNRLDRTKNFLSSTFLLGLSFTGLQFFGWKELTEIGVDFRGLPAGSFLYVLSGIHLFHLIGAMIYALVLVFQIHKCEGDEVKSLILLSNPYEKMKLDLFTVYWKFMDVVWIILFILFIWMF